MHVCIYLICMHVQSHLNKHGNLKKNRDSETRAQQDSEAQKHKHPAQQECETQKQKHHAQQDCETQKK